MTEAITTRRALEVVMSRCRMHHSVSAVLAAMLAQEIAKGHQPPDPDIDAVRAAAMVAEDHLANVSEFDRKALVSRIGLAREALRAALYRT